MGIPKFFRWLSERYPLCSQLVQENRIPEFDNLYLDMNGIIHHCTHGNNDSVHYRISQEKQFSMIFHYIEFIFAKIKPKKIFYMAVDGVAPRAKINQQRSRRFRTAQEAAEKVQKALEKGEVLPEEEAFDSNCITPGTEFMQTLNDHLHYFVCKKISEDENWKECKVIISGHDVPGEGEHKIMEFIRQNRALDDYNPNTRHCLYGLDADLIMLGLLTHDPHFCLLREEVTFGPKSRKKQSTVTHPESQKFYLLHLCLLREYLDIEFSDLRDSLPFEYDFERILDDFIMMAMFVGNDFLPHLPGLHINEGALSTMFECYKLVLPSLGGYINEGGIINMDYLEKLLERLAMLEKVQFENEYVGEELLRSRQSSNKSVTISKSQYDIVQLLKLFLIDPFMKQISLPKNLSTSDLAFAKNLCKELGLFAHCSGKEFSVFRKSFEQSDGDSETETTEALDDDDVSESSEDEESKIARERVFKRYETMPIANNNGFQSADDAMEKAFFDNRRIYYKDKMRIDIENKEQMHKLCGNYIQGLQWVMHYYYNGVQSWGWYYPYHYSPKISDLIPGVKRTYERMPLFQLGMPFEPFEQLMGVMPARCQNLLPEAYRSLMFDSSSPILDFYPVDFEIDMNGKKNSWEAVVKIPFIDEARLLEAMSTKKHMLTISEKIRNERGDTWIYSRSEDARMLEAPKPAYFPNIVHCIAKKEVYKLPEANISNYRKGLLSGVLLGKSSLAGFPSLKTLNYSANLLMYGVRVFQQESKNESVIISILPDKDHREECSALELAQKYLGKSVFVSWPFLAEAQIDSISDSLMRYSIDHSNKSHNNGGSYDNGGTDGEILQKHQIKALPLDPAESTRRANRVEYMKDTFAYKQGIIISDIEILFHCSLLKGMKRWDNGALVKEFVAVDGFTDFPYQLVVFNVEQIDTRFVEKPAPPIDEEFPMGSKGFYLGDGVLYGRMVEVAGYSASRKSLTVRISGGQINTLPIVGKAVVEKYRLEQHYIPSRKVAKTLGINNLVLSRISSSIYVFDGNDKFNIGLCLKYEAKQMKVIGYTLKSVEKGWEYSQAAVDLLSEYQQRFPSVFNALASSNKEFYMIQDIFPHLKSDSDLHEHALSLKAFLDEKGVKSFDQVPLEVEFLSKVFVEELEKEICSNNNNNNNNNDAENSQEMTGVPAHVLLLPSQAPFRLSRRQKFQLGDRVLFAADIGSVPLGCFGTVVGIEKKTSQIAQNAGSYWISVVFDQEFMGGNTLDGRCSGNRGLVVSSECLLNLTNPQPPLHNRFVPGMFLKNQLIKVERKLSDSVEGGKKIYVKKAGQRSLLTALNNGKRPKTAAATPVAKSQQPEKVKRRTSESHSTNVEVATMKLKDLLNLNSTPPASTSPMSPSIDWSKGPSLKVLSSTSGAMEKNDIQPHQLAFTPTSVLQQAKNFKPPTANKDDSDTVSLAYRPKTSFKKGGKKKNFAERPKTAH